MNNRQPDKPLQGFDPDLQATAAERDLEHLRQSLIEYKNRVYSLLSSVLPSFVLGALPLLFSDNAQGNRNTWIPLLSLLPVMLTAPLMSMFLELVIAIRVRAAFCLLLENGIFTNNFPSAYRGWENALVRFDRNLGQAFKDSEDGPANAWLRWLGGNPRLRGPHYVRTGTLLLTVAPLFLALGFIYHSIQAKSWNVLTFSLFPLSFVFVWHLRALRFMRKLAVGGYDLEHIALKMSEILSMPEVKP